ncbi:MAG: sensor domain-containing diguanylate cyclase [Nitrospirota bacterium]
MTGKTAAQNQEWLDRYKKKIILGIVSVMTLSIVVTMFYITCTMRSRLIQERGVQAEELGIVLHSSLNYLMEARDPGKMQNTLVVIGKENPAIVKTFIIDTKGKVAYSSREKDIGATIDRFTDISCKGCHSGPVTVPHDKTMTVTVDGKRVLRHVHIIENQPSCHRCHPADVRINGKLVIDSSLEPTDSLIRTVILIILGSSLACLAVLIPFLWWALSRGVNTYIDEIRTKSAELLILYSIVDRLSATIDFEELKQIIIEIISEALGADEIDMVLPNEYRELGVIVWAKDKSAMQRKKVEVASALHDIIYAWGEGRITEHVIVNEGKEIHMPVSKGDNRLALIIIRSTSGVFEPYQLALVRGMANHISVAFENALLYRMAITDELTGLYSIRHFRQAIGKRYSLFHEFGEKMTLLMIDIDNFKKINDSYGHPAGDAILREVSKCILSSIREPDLGFRYGGEEFAVILPASDIPAGKVVAERMRSLIEHYPFKVDQHVLKVTVSIGVASWPASAESIKELIAEADKALYEAKHGGKNQIVVRASKG